MSHKANHQDQVPYALIVNSCRFQRQLLSLICTESGYAPVEASDGSEALDITQRLPVALLVTDLDLPKIDGFKLLHHIAEINPIPKLLLVSKQGHSILNSADRLARTLGFETLGAVEWPFVADDILDILSSDAVQSATTANTVEDHLEDKGAPLTRQLIEEGIENGALVAFYQPKIHHQESRIVGFECLARWRGADGAIMGADAVVPLAEELGLMTPLTKAMLNHAVRDVASWQSLGWPMPVSVNLSPDNLMDTDLPDHLEWLLAKHGVGPSSITLEITETRVLDEGATCLEVMSRLRLKGFGLSMDDFGTGYSTLKQLQYFPFTELKLDQSYVGSALSHKPSLAVLKTGILLARGLSLTCVAEGVETSAHADLLASLGCHYHQGFLYGKPIPAADVPVWISGWLERGGTMMEPKSGALPSVYITHEPVSMPVAKIRRRNQTAADTGRTDSHEVKPTESSLH